MRSALLVCVLAAAGLGSVLSATTSGYFLDKDIVMKATAKIGYHTAEIIEVSSKLYRRQKDGSVHIYSGTGADNKWTSIGSNCKSLINVGTAIYSLSTDGRIWLYKGTAWKWIVAGSNAAQIIASNSKLFAVSKKHGQTPAYTWRADGIPANEADCKKYAVENNLAQGGAGYAMSGAWSTKGCYTYTSGKYKNKVYWGTGGDATKNAALVSGAKKRAYRWTIIGSQTKQLADTNNKLFGLTFDGRIWRCDDPTKPYKWTVIGTNSKQIIGNAAKLYSVTHDGKAWSCLAAETVKAAPAWVTIGTGTKTLFFQRPNTAWGAEASTNLYRLATNGRTEKYSGSGTVWNNQCGAGYVLSHAGYWGASGRSANDAGKTIAQCKAKCDAAANCVAFNDWGPQTVKHCYIYTTTTSVHHSGSVADPAANVACMKVSCPTGYTMSHMGYWSSAYTDKIFGNSILAKKTIAQCAARCTADKRCVAFSDWKPTDANTGQHCYIYSTVNPHKVHTVKSSGPACIRNADNDATTATASATPGACGALGTAAWYRDRQLTVNLCKDTKPGDECTIKNKICNMGSTDSHVTLLCEPDKSGKWLYPEGRPWWWYGC